jgi:hypothetical protein
MAREDPHRLQETNRRLREALGACEEQLESTRQMIRESRQDNDKALAD